MLRRFAWLGPDVFINVTLGFRIQEEGRKCKRGFR